MKQLSSEFRQRLDNNERDYLAYADLTLVDGTTLSLTNSEIWTGGFSYEESVSDDNVFSALGSVIIGSANLIINNIYDDYSQYDFANAKVVLYLGMQLESRLEKFKLGTYIVDSTSYNGATISLTLLDYMAQFDRSYTLSYLTYPANLSEIVNDACSRCGVTLATLDFPHKEYEIQNAPDGDTVTFREVLSWVASIAGCFVKCNPDGELELKWFDRNSADTFYQTILDGGVFNPWSGSNETVYSGSFSPWSDEQTFNGGTFSPWEEGDAILGGRFNPWVVNGIVDGGVFNPWNTDAGVDGGTFTDSRNVHYISSVYSQNISMDDVIITGISAIVKDETEEGTETLTFMVGSTGYLIEIEDNPFITKDNAETILEWLGTQLIGLTFRKLSIQSASDPSIESGDVGLVIDRKQNVYKILITRTSFSIDSTQTIVCGASTPARNSAERFSSSTKSFAETLKILNQEISNRQAAVASLTEAINSHSGLFTDVVTTASGGSIFYMHDLPALVDSSIVWKMTATAWAVTNDWQGTDEATTAADKWLAGMTVDGEFITQLLSATGISFDWARGGTITLGGYNNTNGRLRILNSDGAEIGNWDNSGITAFGSIICYENT